MNVGVRVHVRVGGLGLRRGRAGIRERGGRLEGGLGLRGGYLPGARVVVAGAGGGRGRAGARVGDVVELGDDGEGGDAVPAFLLVRVVVIFV